MISAVVLTKNEEENLAKCLKSIEFADEIVVIDDDSDDFTTKVAKGFGVKVYSRVIDKGFAAQRNYGQDVAKGDWILFVDADEIVSSKLAAEIKQVVKDDSFAGYMIRRRDSLWGKRLSYGESGNTILLRLARKGSGGWSRQVHESWKINGKIGTLKNHLDHYPHKSLYEFVASVDKWSSIHAQENISEGKRSSVLKIVFYPVFKLFKNIVVDRGALDGTIGVISALMMSFHSFLSWSKMWLLQKNI